MKIVKYILFYLASFTWGIVYSTVGLLVTLGCLITLHKPHRYKYCWYFTIGKDWGGVEFGPCFIVCKNAGPEIYAHEYGHGIQNIILGPLFPILVAIPSAVRYWYREIYFKGLDDIFEAILVCVTTILTFSTILLLINMYVWWLWIIAGICIYLVPFVFWLVYIEAVRYHKDSYPDYYSIWFESMATYLGSKN